MVTLGQFRALVLVASALALASRAAFPVHLPLPGADGIVYVALCTATGIKQVPVPKGGSERGSQEPSPGMQGCAHSLCAASLLVSASVRLPEVQWQHSLRAEVARTVPVVALSEFAYARGPPPVQVRTFA